MKFKAEYRSPRSIITTLRTIPDWHALRTHCLAQLGWNESRRRRRSQSHGDPIPWLPYAAIDYLHQMISTSAEILEIGGGASSAWWLRRGNPVTTIEYDPEWCEQIRRDCAEWSMRHRLIVGDAGQPRNLSSLLENATFDVVINDGPGDRGGAALALAPHVRADGILVWDNSERTEYQDAMAELERIGWRRLDFFGLVPINAYAGQTTIFYRTPIEQRGLRMEYLTVT